MPSSSFLTLLCSPQTQNRAKKSNGRRAVVVFRDAEKSRFLLLHSIIFFALAVYTHTCPNIGARFLFFFFWKKGETKKVEDGISSSFVSLHEALSPRGFQFRALSVLFLFLPPPRGFRAFGLQTLQSLCCRRRRYDSESRFVLVSYRRFFLYSRRQKVQFRFLFCSKGSEIIHISAGTEDMCVQLLPASLVHH